MRVTESSVFFWNGLFSQWYASSFEIDGKNFNTAEQYMMYKKAILFGDEDIANAIMRTRDPKEQKSLGRQVRGFDEDVWKSHCKKFVYEANYAKFTQDQDLLNEFVSYGDREIVEASPQDKIWGIGLHYNDKRCEYKSQWKGTNWLGEAIMRVRQTLKGEGKFNTNTMDFLHQKQPPKSSAAEGNNAEYIHQFGYHFARKILGEKKVDKVCRKGEIIGNITLKLCDLPHLSHTTYPLHLAYESELQNPKQNQQHCFRANWRSSSVQMPWNLPTIQPDFLEDDVNPQCLFVDITFDFLIFPSEVVSEGRTKHCHVVKKADFWDETFQRNDTDESDSIALSVAIRAGALVAIPSCQCSDIISTSGSKRDVDGGIKSDTDYQYYYMRGDKALTVADLDDHCSRIEIIREGMGSKDVANIVGTAFLDGCSSSIPWQVVAKKKHTNDTTKSNSLNDMTTIDGNNQSKNQSNLTCHLKLHDKSFNADGILPLSSNDGLTISSLDRSMLDMILLQSNTSSGDGDIVSVPKSEALSLWKVVDESLIKALEKPIEPSPQKMSPASFKVAAKEEDSPPQKAAPKEEETKTTEQPRKVVIRRPPKPQEQALFAKGKKTTLGGGRRKKPKFRMGPA